jgi:hypothetical protein
MREVVLDRNTTLKWERKVDVMASGFLQQQKTTTETFYKFLTILQRCDTRAGLKSRKLSRN